MKHWKVYGAIVVAIASVVYVVLDWPRFLSDFWPLDKSSVGPNLLASVVQWAIILVVASLVYPPTRRAIERFVAGHVSAIKAHVTSGQAELHDKLDHIIRHHPDIPPFEK